MFKLADKQYQLITKSGNFFSFYFIYPHHSSDMPSYLMHYFNAFLFPVLLEVFFICGSTYSSYFTSVMPIFFHTYQQEDLVTQNEFRFKVIWPGLFCYLAEPLRVRDHTVKRWDCLLSNAAQIPQECWNGVNTTQVLQPCTLKVWQGNHYWSWLNIFS